ncbi:MAG TPA: PD-(D/E)XK nuclease family protein, partial [Methylophilaceae bacterium]|nr:PD-(D/E)XK nuclease family protein [Methylophilaceae bacterium]
ELAVLRERLASLLDDNLHPASIQAANVEMPRSYDFSLGQPLAAHPVVAVAIALLRLCAGRRRVSQESFSPLLLQRYWSADVTEADARARFDARLRRKLPQTISLKRIVRYAEYLTNTPRLVGNLHACITLLDAQPSTCLPSAWVKTLQGLLVSLGWPGERSLSSHEFQAQQAFQETLGAIGRLDVLLGKVTLSGIVQQLVQNCRERISQPRSLGNPGLQILGLLEAAGRPLDAMWVMGMNDHIWPPPPRPNPLLPAAVQRAVGTPNADSAVQAEFALAIHQRLLQSAPHIIFSWAGKDADRMLRISPLIAGLPAMTNLSLAATLAEQCLPAGGFKPQKLDDHLAPPIAEGEHVRGGTGLLKAQAICPAWAFYQYRLGARKLESPVDGLDMLERGSLVHAVLERFWTGRDSGILQPSKTDERQMAIDEAVKHAIAELNEKLDQPLPTRLMALERHRLLRLMEAWLQFEASRQVPFAVQACECEIIQDIEGIEVRLLIDRVDALDDGRLVVIDYKTGAIPDYKNWAELRMTEPQLPVYAALALASETVAAICFAGVKRAEQSFSGIAAEANLLPGVKHLEDKKTREIFTSEALPDWQALLQYWQQNIRAIAAEIKAGEAAVRFAEEEELK